MDAAVGGGIVRASGHNVIAPSVVNVQLGVYVHRTTSISVRLASAFALHATIDGGTTVTTTGFLGPSVQTWPSERWFVSAGAGWFDASTSDERATVRTSGFGLDGRVGYAFHTTAHHSLYTALEIFSGGSTRHTSVAAQLGWQVF